MGWTSELGFEEGWNVRVIAFLLVFMLSGCAVQWSLGPSTWNTAPPVIPGFTPLPLPGGGFVEEPTSALTGAAAPTPPPPTEIETVLTGLEQAQKVRTAVRQLAR